jgi:preprotein translocase subunit SecD
MSKRLRFFVLLLVLGIGVAFLYPTVNWYFFVPEDLKEIASGTREQVRQYAQEMARQDAQSLTALASADPSQPLPDEFSYLIDVVRPVFRQANRPIPRTWTVGDVVGGFRNQAELTRAAEAHHRDLILGLKDQKRRIIQLGLDLSGGMRVVLEADVNSLAARIGRTPNEAEVSDAIDLALEILNNRIDQFGVTEPSIRKEEGTNRILVEIPGDADPERVNAFLMGRGSLNLQLVDPQAFQQMQGFLADYRARNNVDWFPGSSEQPDFIPAGTAIRPVVQRDSFGIDQIVSYIVTRENPESIVDGSFIQEAIVGRDNITARPTVNFVLNSEGGELMRVMSRDNVGTPLAITMDGRVRAYATISEELGSNVMIRGFTLEESNNIARVLRTAALPVDLEIISLQTVGASLGEDAIAAGVQAIILGLVLVVVFILGYYLAGGLVASIGLLVNFFMIIATLSAFNLTLTLTSIAGLILTVGMAVDANVIIFERIKEEYRLGKSAAASIQAGYKKAFWTIMDANLTTFIAALFLSYLGTGPIQGFAVTLAVGIVFSVFSALFVTRLIYDFSTDVLKRNSLSIAWRLKQ